LHSRGENDEKPEFVMAQWRRFAFFDKEVLKDASGPWMKVGILAL
jgi:hypothetical protein